MDRSAQMWMGIAITVTAIVFLVFGSLFNTVKDKVGDGSSGYSKVVNDASIPTESDPSGGN